MAHDRDARVLRDALDHLLQLARDAPNAHAGGVGKRGDARAGFAFEPRAQWAKYARAGEEAVDEHDYVVSGANVGYDRREIAGHERHLAEQGNHLGPDELLEGDRQTHRKAKQAPTRRGRPT